MNVALLFVYFLGLGSYVASLSAFGLAAFGPDARWVFLAGQVAYPLGYVLGGYLSDRTRRIRPLLVIGLLVLIPAQYTLFDSGQDLGAAIVASAVSRLCLAGNLQLIGTALLESAGSDPFARMRSAGTIGFGVVQALLLFLADFSPVSVGTWDFGNAGKAGALAYAVCLLLLAHIPIQRHSREHFEFAAALRLWISDSRWRLLALAFVFYFGFQLVENYLGAYLNQRGGRSQVYGAWLLAVALEVPFLFWTARLARKFGVHILFRIAAAMGVIRFTTVALDTLYPGTMPVLTSQVLHGMHFMGFYIGAIYWIRSSFPDHLYGSAFGTFQIAGNALGGISGNLIYGWLLSRAPVLLDIHGDAGPEPLAFFPVFASAALLQALILPLFMLVRQPRFRE
ncbi:MAG: MFS transporter [Spirochaetales bacterium]|nr:MFS transporter [Leptospiraceae bacterium]MCP5481237.1 MFS transporter [Spirochaetales bacterium]MCP5485673.1 MFS transporter [Spirochaetales bacterium]